MFSVKHKGNFKNTENFLTKAPSIDYAAILNRYGSQGVSALSSATPKDSGETSASWSYEIIHESHKSYIVWNNSHMAGTAPVAILLQYGHGTRNGGFVQGIDFINPALKPIFDKIASDAWGEVTRI